MAKREYTVVLPKRGKKRHATFLIPNETHEVGKAICGRKMTGWRVEGTQETFNNDCVRCMSVVAKRIIRRVA